MQIQGEKRLWKENNGEEKMVQHMKRIATPRSWPIHRKEDTWVSAPKGGHSYELSLPVNVVLNDMLKIVKTRKESRYIIFNKNVLVNGKKVNSERVQVGLFDVLSLPEIKANFTLLLNSRGKLKISELDEKAAESKLSKVIGKTYLPDKKVQLNLFGGINTVVKKDEYSVGDSLIISLKDYKVSDHIKLEKGAVVYFLTGKNISKTAVVESIEGSVLICKSDDREIRVAKKDAIVVGKGKQAIKL